MDEGRVVSEETGVPRAGLAVEDRVDGVVEDDADVELVGRGGALEFVRFGGCGGCAVGAGDRMGLGYGDDGWGGGGGWVAGGVGFRAGWMAAGCWLSAWVAVGLCS